MPAQRGWGRTGGAGQRAWLEPHPWPVSCDGGKTCELGQNPQSLRHLLYGPFMPYEWDVAVGQHLSREERRQRFGGASYGGIEASAVTPNVFVYSDPGRGAAYGYNFDGWSADGSLFYYTGEGRRGDQLMREGNKALVGHAQAGRSLRLFVADGLVAGTSAKSQLYVGEFAIDAQQPFTIEDAPDAAQELRTVFVFRLRPVGPAAYRQQDESSAPAPGTAGVASLVSLETNQAHVFEVPGSPPATATKREAELVRRYILTLTNQRHCLRRWKLRPPGELTSMLTDLYDETVRELYEAKGSANRPSVRLALGQLLDYVRHLPDQPTKMTVLLPNPPADDLVALLHNYCVGVVWETSAGVFVRRDPSKPVSDSGAG